MDTTTHTQQDPRVLCTFPGKFGDLLWSLPTVRAVSEALGAPVDLVIAGAFGGIVPLLAGQGYLGRVWADPSWVTQDTAPISPRVAPDAVGVFGTYDHVLHLGYDGWPALGLPHEVHRILGDQWPWPAPIPAIDLARPWITPPTWAAQLPTQDVALGFTEEHFELKAGITTLIQRRDPAPAVVNLSTGPRWFGEYYRGGGGLDWEAAAAYLARSAVFLGDCSALHVLACAIGTPCVLLEPNPHRHHPIFWPFGTTGPRVTQVLGTDGNWTFDARHVWESLQARIAQRRAEERVPCG